MTRVCGVREWNERLRQCGGGGGGELIRLPMGFLCKIEV